MLDVLTGFAIIYFVIGTGYLLSLRGKIGPGKQRLTLNYVAFYAATPALLFHNVSHTDIGTFFSPVFAVVVIASFLSAAAYALLSYRPGRPGATSAADIATGAGASSFFNTVNIGLPISAYVIGDISYVVPVILFQSLILTPIILAVLSGGSLGNALRSSVGSPIVIAPLLGLLVSWSGLTIPAIIAEPIELLGGASIPLVLLSFGASLTTAKVLDNPSVRPAIMTATALKLLGMPVAAVVVARLLGLDAASTYAAVILSALPTAQQIYNYAATFQRGEIIARDTVLITTFASLPVMLAIAAVLAP